MSKDPNEDKLINKLFAEYKQMMFKIAFSILHNRSDAEDAVQDAFLSIINNFEKISQMPCHERANYFASITEHRSIDIYRKRSRHPTEDLDEFYDLSSDENIEEKAFSDLTVEEIKSALDELSDRDYELLYLYLFKEMSPAKISGLMGIPENNIRTYIMRARKRFVKILRERGIDYDV